ncbi:synaptonemal complex protein 2 isoform X3 [Hyperolius riggenbachi]|uniref:synaptonemal complex protein 2 isoform X3 n=1 Tax=Hyperolius riggenbachi TaxID=752182 RepID=UPI0035A36206
MLSSEDKQLEAHIDHALRRHEFQPLEGFLKKESVSQKCSKEFFQKFDKLVCRELEKKEIKNVSLVFNAFFKFGIDLTSNGEEWLTSAIRQGLAEKMVVWFGKIRDILMCLGSVKNEALLNLTEDFFDLLMVVHEHSSDGKTQILERFIVRTCSLVSETTINTFIKQAAVLKLNLMLDNIPPGLRKKLIFTNEMMTIMSAMGKRILDAGDYDLQVAITEALCRMTSEAQREELCVHWFPMELVTNAFRKIKDAAFETDCRKFLNLVNGMLGDKRRVFTFPCLSAHLEDHKLQTPCDDKLEEFWMDFNMGTQSLSFYVSADGEEQHWETVSITENEVEVYSIEDVGSKVLLSLILNTPATVGQRRGSHIRIFFDCTLDIADAVRRVFGAHKCKNFIKKQGMSVARTTVHVIFDGKGSQTLIPESQDSVYSTKHATATNTDDVRTKSQPYLTTPSNNQKNRQEDSKFATPRRSKFSEASINIIVPGGHKTVIPTVAVTTPSVVKKRMKPPLEMTTSAQKGVLPVPSDGGRTSSLRKIAPCKKKPPAAGRETVQTSDRVQSLTKKAHEQTDIVPDTQFPAGLKTPVMPGLSSTCLSANKMRTRSVHQKAKISTTNGCLSNKDKVVGDLIAKQKIFSLALEGEICEQNKKDKGTSHQKMKHQPEKTSKATKGESRQTKEQTTGRQKHRNLKRADPSLKSKSRKSEIASPADGTADKALFDNKKEGPHVAKRYKSEIPTHVDTKKTDFGNTNESPNVVRKEKVDVPSRGIATDKKTDFDNTNQGPNVGKRGKLDVASHSKASDKTRFDNLNEGPNVGRRRKLDVPSHDIATDKKTDFDNTNEGPNVGKRRKLDVPSHGIATDTKTNFDNTNEGPNVGRRGKLDVLSRGKAPDKKTDFDNMNVGRRGKLDVSSHESTSDKNNDFDDMNESRNIGRGKSDISSHCNNSYNKSELDTSKDESLNIAKSKSSADAAKEKELDRLKDDKTNHDVVRSFVAKIRSKYCQNTTAKSQATAAWQNISKYSAQSSKAKRQTEIETSSSRRGQPWTDVYSFGSEECDNPTIELAVPSVKTASSVSATNAEKPAEKKQKSNTGTEQKARPFCRPHLFSDTDTDRGGDDSKTDISWLKDPASRQKAKIVGYSRQKQMKPPEEPVPYKTGEIAKQNRKKNTGCKETFELDANKETDKVAAKPSVFKLPQRAAAKRKCYKERSNSESESDASPVRKQTSKDQHAFDLGANKETNKKDDRQGVFKLPQRGALKRKNYKEAFNSDSESDTRNASRARIEPAKDLYGVHVNKKPGPTDQPKRPESITSKRNQNAGAKAEDSIITTGKADNTAAVSKADKSLYKRPAISPVSSSPESIEKVRAEYSDLADHTAVARLSLSPSPRLYLSPPGIDPPEQLLGKSLAPLGATTDERSIDTTRQGAASCDTSQETLSPTHSRVSMASANLNHSVVSGVHFLELPKPRYNEQKTAKKITSSSSCYSSCDVKASSSVNFQSGPTMQSTMKYLRHFTKKSSHLAEESDLVPKHKKVKLVPRRLFPDSEEKENKAPEMATSTVSGKEASSGGLDTWDEGGSEVGQRCQKIGKEVTRKIQSRSRRVDYFTEKSLQSAQKHLNVVDAKVREFRIVHLEKFQQTLLDEIERFEKDAKALKQMEKESINFWSQQIQVLKLCHKNEKKRIQCLKASFQNNVSLCLDNEDRIYNTEVYN